MCDENPPWVIEDHTADLLNKLKTAQFNLLENDKTDEASSKRILNILYHAGLEFQYHCAYYNHYVPVFVISPVTRRPETPPLPTHLSVQFTSKDKNKVKELKEAFQTTPAGKGPEDAFSYGAKTVNWEAAKIIASRISAYIDFLKAGTDVGKAVRSFSVGLASQFFDVSAMIIEETNPDSPGLKALVYCPGFLLSASTTSLSAPLGIGVIGIIATLELYAKCLENMVAYVDQINPIIKEVSNSKQIAQTVNRDKPGNNYKKDGDIIKMFNGDILGEEYKTSDVNQVKVTIEKPEDKNYKGKGEFYERDLADGGRERCFGFKETKSYSDGSWKERSWEFCHNMDTGDQSYNDSPKLP